MKIRIEFSEWKCAKGWIYKELKFMFLNIRITFVS